MALVKIGLGGLISAARNDSKYIPKIIETLKNKGIKDLNIDLKPTELSKILGVDHEILNRSIRKAVNRSLKKDAGESIEISPELYSFGKRLTRGNRQRGGKKGAKLGQGQGYDINLKNFLDEIQTSATIQGKNISSATSVSEVQTSFRKKIEDYAEKRFNSSLNELDEIDKSKVLKGISDKENLRNLKNAKLPKGTPALERFEVDHIKGQTEFLRKLGLGEKDFNKFLATKGKSLDNLSPKDLDIEFDAFIKDLETGKDGFLNFQNLNQLYGSKNLQVVKRKYHAPSKAGGIRAGKGYAFDDPTHSIQARLATYKRLNDEYLDLIAFQNKELPRTSANLNQLKNSHSDYKRTSTIFDSWDNFDKQVGKRITDIENSLGTDYLGSKYDQVIAGVYEGASAKAKQFGYKIPAISDNPNIPNWLLDDYNISYKADGGSVGTPFDKKIKEYQDMGMELKDAIEEARKDFERDRTKLSIGGLASNRTGLNLDDRVSKVGTLESMLAGVGAGLIDIPKGAFSLGAALLDLGFGTSNAAKVENFFDNLTTLDEKAEQTFAGDLTRIMVNLGVPGGFAFKAGTNLATKALLNKKNGNYFRLTDPKLQERYKTALNTPGRLFATLGGAGAAGVSDMIFVGDPEHVGTIGDMFGGPTQLKPNDENNAAREVANRMKFGLDSSLLIGAVGGLGSSIKSLIRRSNELETNNDSIDKFLSYLRPRGKKTQEFFDIERANLGTRRSDINRAEEISRRLDKHIDAIFPFVKNPFNKLGNKGRREFMAKLNDTLLSGDYNISSATGKTEFGLMDKKLVEEVTEMMTKKGGKAEDVQGVLDQFYNIRAGWQLMFDDLGTAMGKDALKEFAPLFGKKFKDYLGSTYEIFRNKSVIPLLNYKPTEQAVKKMMNLFKESASEKGVKLSDEQAEYYVDELLSTARPTTTISTAAERSSGVYFNAPDFFVNKSVLDDIEMPRKTLPLDSLTDDAKEVVEELLGKVQDPLQTILTGTNKLSLVTRRNQLFQTLNKSNQEILEKRRKFIEENPGKEIPAALRGMFRETEIEAINDLGKNIKQIKLDPSRTEEAGIVNPLDGLYAERGVAEAIEETAMIARDKSNLFQLYQNFILYPKATSQMAKTILSPITHARNFISAGAFAAANGIIPGLTVSFDDTGRAFKEAYGALQIPGARFDNSRYRELLRLGVVNTNVRLGDLQKLLKDVNFGESFDSSVALRNMMRPMSKLKKWTEDMYTAEDDFWKISTFAIERSRMKDTYDKFGMKYTKELLDEEAAKIVKNNVPNYDYVNDFVKDLRQLPFGNFVSFPAEIYRTGYNIMNQAWKEIFTTHTLADGRVVNPFRTTGMKRMFGLASTVVGVPYGTVEAFKAIHDVTEEEMSALRRFVPEWSKNSTLVPIRSEDGTLKYVDFSHANAYDTLIRPVTTLMNGVQQGLEEDQVFKNTFLAMLDATKETASPFVSESIWTQALFDVAPIAGRGGRTLEGRRLWTDETPWGDAFYAGIKHLGATVVPGSLPALGRMRDALTETVDEYGRSYEFGDELLGVAGMRVVDVDPVNSMKFKIADFRTGINNSRREFTGPLLRGGPITPEQVVDQYEKANQSLFRVQQRMFRDYYAARTLGVSDRALQNTFQDRVSNKQVRAIQAGRFTPFIPSENIEQAFADNARAIGEPNAYRAAKDQIRRLIGRYERLKMNDQFPLIDNPFRINISERVTAPIAQIGGSPLDNTTLAQPLIGGQQLPTAQRGQQVFGPLDTVFGN
jgi:hypothetical protein